MNPEGKAKADKLRAELKRYSAGKRARKVAHLIGEGADGRKELKKMRDTWYGTEPYYPSAGQYHNPEGKRHVRGSDSKARKINSGHAARKAQAKGL